MSEEPAPASNELAQLLGMSLLLGFTTFLLTYMCVSCVVDHLGAAHWIIVLAPVGVVIAGVRADYKNGFAHIRSRTTRQAQQRAYGDVLGYFWLGLKSLKP